MSNVIQHPVHKHRKALAKFYKKVDAAAAQLLVDTNLELCAESRVSTLRSALNSDVPLFDEKDWPCG